jgi:hypothetical protein
MAPSALLGILTLLLAAQRAHSFPDLKNSALISVRRFCDNGFETQFTKQRMLVMMDNTNNIVLKGKRDHTTGQWWILRLD